MKSAREQAEEFIELIKVTYYDKDYDKEEKFKQVKNRFINHHNKLQAEKRNKIKKKKKMKKNNKF